MHYIVVPFLSGVTRSSTFPLPQNFSQKLPKEGCCKSFKTRKQTAEKHDWSLYLCLIVGYYKEVSLEQGSAVKECVWDNWKLLNWLSRDVCGHFAHLSCSLAAHEQRPSHWRHWGCCHPCWHLTCGERMDTRKKQSYATSYPFRMTPEHIILFLHRCFIAWDTSVFK